VAPFAIFMSEFQVLRAAAEVQSVAALILFPIGAGIVFVGALRHVMSTAWGEAISAPTPEPFGAVDLALVGGALLALLMLGLWLPLPLADGLAAAARVIGGRP
jgi:formate hydrogenlyase subunit 3/multisubunit Na+/H+ antiporter MnhD subunit